MQINNNFANIARDIIDDGRPIQAGDAFEIDMVTGNARRVGLDEMPPEVAEQVKRIQGIVDRDEEYCEACGGPCNGFSVPGGDPIAHFQRVCEVANLPMPETVGEVLEILQILEAADRLRDGDRIVRERALEADQNAREQQTREQVGGFLSRVFSGERARKRSRVNGPGEPAPKVSESFDGHTLVITTPDDQQHAFWSQTISGSVDLLAAHLREHLDESSEGFLVNSIRGRINR